MEYKEGERAWYFNGIRVIERDFNGGHPFELYGWLG